MKKTISIMLLVCIILTLATTVVKAATAASLVDDLYALTSKYGVTNADKVKAQRHLNEISITDEQANQIYEKAKEAVKVLEEAGATDVKKLNTQLTRDQKIRFEALCQEAAAIVGATLTYKNGTVEVYKDGKLVDIFYFTDKLAYTGNNFNIVLVVSSVAVIALATTFIVRKRFANA